MLKGGRLAGIDLSGGGIGAPRGQKVAEEGSASDSEEEDENKKKGK